MRSSADQDFRRQLVGLLPRLRRFALSLTSDPVQADDLVQAACERALARQHQWRPGSRLDSWMFKIIRNLLIDDFRSPRRRLVHIPWQEDRFTANTGNGSRRMEARFKLERVAQAMQQLAESDRVLISLVCIEGMSYRNVAETLEVPMGTVMSRLARARKKLHQLAAGE